MDFKIAEVKQALNLQVQAGDFDWSMYEDGYNGKNLKVNKKVNTGNKRIKVYSHEPYAQETFAKYVNSVSNISAAKDLVKGTCLTLTDVVPSGRTSLTATTSGGGTVIIDMTKERQYMDLFCKNISAEDFVSAVNDPDEKAAFMANTPSIKVMEHGRVSLFDGHLDKLSAELWEQKNMDNPTLIYNAHVLSANGGGYLVSVQGMECFLPGGQAAAGIITDFESLIGKDIPVMVINFVRGKGFIVSYKKYLSSILPQKILTELSVDQMVMCTVTGVDKPGVFVSFKDNNGEPVFSGLIHKDEVCDFMEPMFENREFRKGDCMRAYIHKIYRTDNGTLRIVLGDTPTTNESYVGKQARLKAESAEAAKARETEKKED